MTSEKAARERALFVIPEEILTSLDTGSRNISYAVFMLRLNGREPELGLPAVSQDHPDPTLLERFMTNKVSGAEAASIIRHLLKGCPTCSQVTGQLWRLGSRTPLNLEGQT